MKNHIVTIILLLLAVAFFVLRFLWDGSLQIYCDIAAFALPTLAAVVEIVVSERSSQRMEEELKKRAIWKVLTPEEYDKLQDDELDENTFYAKVEKKK